MAIVIVVIGSIAAVGLLMLVLAMLYGSDGMEDTRHSMPPSHHAPGEKDVDK